MSAGDELKLAKVKGRGKCGVRSGVMFVIPQRVGKEAVLELGLQRWGDL